MRRYGIPITMHIAKALAKVYIPCTANAFCYFYIYRHRIPRCYIVIRVWNLLIFPCFLKLRLDIIMKS